MHYEFTTTAERQNLRNDEVKLSIVGRLIQLKPNKSYKVTITEQL